MSEVLGMTFHSSSLDPAKEFGRTRRLYPKVLTLRCQAPYGPHHSNLPVGRS